MCSTNIVSRETLLAAKEHPDQYRDLVVRVAGYSAFSPHYRQIHKTILSRVQNIRWREFEKKTRDGVFH